MLTNATEVYTENYHDENNFGVKTYVWNERSHPTDQSIRRYGFRRSSATSPSQPNYIFTVKFTNIISWQYSIQSRFLFWWVLLFLSSQTASLRIFNSSASSIPIEFPISSRIWSIRMMNLEKINILQKTRQITQWGPSKRTQLSNTIVSSSSKSRQNTSNTSVSS